MTSGICSLCNSKYTKAGMTRHLKSCIPKSLRNQLEQSNQQKPFFHILVTGQYAPDYWLYLKVNCEASLETLDQFLRDIWLECCGHLSAFLYKGNKLGMRRKLQDILKPGMELLHEYDFGTTTVLSLKVLGSYEGPIKKNMPIQILSRNEAPEILCDECGKAPAVEICTECQWGEGGWLCQSCAETHQCDEDMYLPVMNSPRTGVCGYTG